MPIHAGDFGRFADEVREIAADRALGLVERAATDILWAFSTPDLYRSLVVERGWSADRHEVWLARTLRQQFLA